MATTHRTWGIKSPLPIPVDVMETWAEDFSTTGTPSILTATIAVPLGAIMWAEEMGGVNTLVDEMLGTSLVEITYRLNREATMSLWADPDNQPNLDARFPEDLIALTVEGIIDFEGEGWLDD